VADGAGLVALGHLAVDEAHLGFVGLGCPGMPGLRNGRLCVCRYLQKNLGLESVSNFDPGDLLFPNGQVSLTVGSGLGNSCAGVGIVWL
jgi:hypothetical protein